MNVEDVDKVMSPEEEAIEKEREIRMTRAMINDLGVSRKNDLPLDNEIRDRGHRNLQAVGNIQPKRKLESERKIIQEKPEALQAWKSARFDDIDGIDDAVDELGSGQSHRQRMVASLADQGVVRGGSSYRVGRGGVSPRGGGTRAMGSHDRGSSFDSRGRTKPSRIAPRGTSMIAAHIGSQAGRPGGITTSPRGLRTFPPRHMGRANETRTAPPKPDFGVLASETTSRETASVNNTIFTGSTIQSMSGPTVIARKQVVIDKKADGVKERLGQGNVRITSVGSDASAPKILDVWILGGTVFEAPLETEFAFNVESSTVSFSSNTNGITVNWVLTFPSESVAKSWGEVLASNKLPAKTSIPTESGTKTNTEVKEEETPLISFSDDIPGQQSPSAYGSDMMSLMGEPVVLQPANDAMGFEMPIQTTPLAQIADQVDEKAAAGSTFSGEEKPQKTYFGGLATSKYAGPAIQGRFEMSSSIGHKKPLKSGEPSHIGAIGEIERHLHPPKSMVDPPASQHLSDTQTQTSSSDSALSEHDRLSKEFLKLGGLTTSKWGLGRPAREMTRNHQLTSTATVTRSVSQDLGRLRSESTGEKVVALENQKPVSTSGNATSHRGPFCSRQSNESTWTVEPPTLIYSGGALGSLNESQKENSHNWPLWRTKSSGLIASSLPEAQVFQGRDITRKIAPGSGEVAQHTLAIVTQDSNNASQPHSRKAQSTTSSSQISNIKSDACSIQSLHSVDANGQANAVSNFNVGSPISGSSSFLKPTAIDFNPSAVTNAQLREAIQTVNLWVSFHPPLQAVVVRWDDLLQPGNILETRGLLQTGMKPLVGHRLAHISAISMDNSRLSENIAPHVAVPDACESLACADGLGPRQPLVDRDDNLQDVQRHLRARLRQSLQQREPLTRGTSS